MKRVCCIQFARRQSSRITEKLTRIVGGNTLIVRGVKYLRELGNRTGVVPLLATSDEEFACVAEESGVEVLRMNPQSETARIWPELIRPFIGELASRFDVVWDTNICCRPFLRVETGEFIARQCQAAETAFVCVTRKRGLVWSETSPVPVIGAGELADTRNNPFYFEPAHLAYCYPAWMLPLSETELATVVRPLEIQLDWKERIDIDTLEDLEFARIVARAGA